MRGVGKMICGAVAVSLALSAPAAGAGRPSGLRITVQSVDRISGEVDFDVTLFTDRPFPHGAAQGLLGELAYTTFNGFTATVLDPRVPALDYGDGQVLPALRLPRVGPGTYRASFRHTYPGPGVYPLRAGALTCIGLQAGPDCAPAGTPDGAPFAFGQPVAADRVEFRVYTTWTNTTATFTYDYPQPRVVGVTNTPGPFQPHPHPVTAGLHIPEAHALEIPTISWTGLAALVALLSGCALALLRRG
jgi:hypothetical protein